MIVSGNSRYGVISAYVPPADTTTLVHITVALARFPSRKVILVGDLNLNLDSIERDRDVETADILAASRLLDIHHHFKLRRKFKQQNSWQHKRKGTVVRSRPDYFLCLDQRIMRRHGIRDPDHFVTDHKLVFGTLTSNTLKENKYYLHSRTKFPH